MSKIKPDSTIFRVMSDQTMRIIDREMRANEMLHTPKKRWDQKDQEEFDKIPLATLLDDPYYLGVGDDLYPAHRRDIFDLFEAKKKYGTHTAAFIEGIGSGKTYKFCALMWLMVAKVLTRVNPQEYYNLSGRGGQGISFICMSRNAVLAKEVTFTTVLPFFSCPFFTEYFPPQVDFVKMEDTRKKPSKLLFPKSVAIFPGTGSALSALGYNLFGGGVDEANYLELVDKSKRSLSGRRYDAAEEMYNGILARMRSRFVTPGGRLPGLMILFSNTRSDMDFMERLAQRAKDDKQIFLRRRCTWEAHPIEKYSGDTFEYDVGNRTIIGV